MVTFFVITFCIAAAWGLIKLTAPWRQYHKEKIAPLERDLEEARSRRAKKEQERQEMAATAGLFTRDFSMERAAHYSAKTTAYERLRKVKAEKDLLIEQQNRVRDRLDRWHRSSRSFFGNTGQKVKDDSLLGWFGLEQTVAQKESLERQRASLSREIGRLNELNSEIDQNHVVAAKDAIGAIAKDIKRRDALKRAGMGEGHFKAQVSRITSELGLIDTEVARIQRAIVDARAGYRPKN